MTEQTITRVLSPRQVETRARLMAAGTTVAERQGLDFTMREVAQQAGVSTATTYSYFASKEHLLAEVYATWVDQFTDRLDARPPLSDDVFERVKKVIGRATEGVAHSPRLASAFTLAMASSDPTVATIRPRIRGAFDHWLDLALADDVRKDRKAVVRTLELTLYAGMIAHAHGNLTPGELRGHLYDAARLLLRGAQEGTAT